MRMMCSQYIIGIPNSLYGHRIGVVYTIVNSMYVNRNKYHLLVLNPYTECSAGSIPAGGGFRSVYEVGVNSTHKECG